MLFNLINMTNLCEKNIQNDHVGRIALLYEQVIIWGHIVRKKVMGDVTERYKSMQDVEKVDSEGPHPPLSYF